jgi:hypothetical protein
LADDDIARGNVAPRQQALAAHGADGKAGEVVVVAVIDARHFRGLAADQRAADLAAGGRDAFHYLGADSGVELAAGEVVEEKQRFGALHDQIVD